MLVDLTDRVVLVTGGGRGIGRALVERFVHEGAQVAAFDVAFPEDPVEGVLEIEGDVTDAASVQSGVDQVAERFGGIDVLVNNAGINVEGRVEDLDLAAWRRCFDVNVTGVFLMSQAVLPHVKASGHGRILNAASFAAIVPSVGAAAYGASKAAVVQFTRVLAGELGPWDVTVNAYAPGMVPSAMNGFETMPQATQDRLLDTLTLRRWGTADSIADLLVFLASDAAAYITGTLVDVSGGKLATQLPQRAYEGLSPSAS
ncbi:SDR family oxidoreductase [Frigoribacterium sp. ACAM 257]|uniref:SDR family NAD(P)-dependent oxidoreductase n=1 Tax=Frigoribacterium sp. ACAM 257 TaxID=2508998 RepID=UPI0011BA2260|nr:SDR family NAD(P)-dependent oxidoreductase [Frigoribacterium sp. ACAM 257]TWX36220.1 SDR family oxidoreductase [Frigoribacterium sp. ACAM 257]